MAISDQVKRKLIRQHYGMVGEHSAVKLCTWTKKSLKDEGYCYKQHFYGIESHMCCQMTPSVGNCPNNCIYCWREVEHTLPSETSPVDDPITIYEQSIISQRRLISGFGGTHKTNTEKLREAQNPRHFAISLSGEPTAYPRLNELIRIIHTHNGTTFLVTNGMFPKALERLEMPTQLYLSLTSTSPGQFAILHQSLFNDGWDRLNSSLAIMSQLHTRTRTAVRITAIKGLNMDHPETWAELVEKANPLFLEIKAYMFVGASRHRLSLANMPLHAEVLEFAGQISAHSSYRIIDQKSESRVVLLMKHDSPDRFIDI